MGTVVAEPDRIVDRAGSARRVTSLEDVGGRRIATVEGPSGPTRLAIDPLETRDGAWVLPCTWDELCAGSELVVPLVREQVEIGTRAVERGRVRVSKRVLQEEQVVGLPLEVQEARIERVRVDRWVDEPPTPRLEGDELIVPVLEEVLVVEKRLRVREEVHVRLERRTQQVERQVTVRREEAVVERLPASDAGGETDPDRRGS